MTIQQPLQDDDENIRAQVLADRLAALSRLRRAQKRGH